MRLRQAALALVLTLAAPWSLAGEYVVGILTPLSGAWSPVGQSMRDGIALALEQAEDRGRFRPGVRLSLKDFDDDAAPADLARRTERMVHDQDAILVIGPMFSTNAQAMAVTANRFAFPLLTPAVSEGITAAGRWAFRSGASPHRMIEAMTRTAIDALHARKSPPSTPRPIRASRRRRIRWGVWLPRWASWWSAKSPLPPTTKTDSRNRWPR